MASITDDQMIQFWIMFVRKGLQILRFCRVPAHGYAELRSPILASPIREFPDRQIPEFLCRQFSVWTCGVSIIEIPSVSGTHFHPCFRSATVVISTMVEADRRWGMAMMTTPRPANQQAQKSPNQGASSVSSSAVSLLPGGPNFSNALGITNTLTMPRTSKPAITPATGGLTKATTPAVTKPARAIAKP